MTIQRLVAKLEQHIPQQIDSRLASRLGFLDHHVCIVQGESGLASSLDHLLQSILVVSLR